MFITWCTIHSPLSGQRAHRTQSSTHCAYFASMVAERCWFRLSCLLWWSASAKFVDKSLKESETRCWLWRWSHKLSLTLLTFENLGSGVRSDWISALKKQWEHCSSRSTPWQFRMQHLRWNWKVSRTSHKVLQNCLERSRQCWIVGKPPVFSGREENFTSTCGPRKSRTTCQVCFRTCVELWRWQWGVTSRGHINNSSAWCAWTWSWDVDRDRRTTFRSAVSPHGQWKLLRCDVSRRRQWLWELASCTEGMIRTQRDVHEVSWGPFCRRREWNCRSWWAPSKGWKISCEDTMVDETPKETCTLLRKTFAWVRLKPCCRTISRNTCSWTVRDWTRMVSWEKRSKRSECRGHSISRNTKQKGPSHPGRDDPMDIGAFGKGNGKQSKGKHCKGKWGRWSLVKVISFSAQQLENLSSLTNNCTLMVVTVEKRISEIVVFKHQCASRYCLSVSTRRRDESQTCTTTKVTCSTKFRLLRIKSIRGSRRSWEILNTVGARLRTKRTTCGWFPAGSEPVRPENEKDQGEARGARGARGAGGAHHRIGDDVDVDEAMVPRVPNLPPEPSARQIAEHVLTDMQCTVAGVAIALRRRVERTHIPIEEKENCPKLAYTTASSVVTEKTCCRSCVSKVETIQLRAWEQQLLRGRVRQIVRVHFWQHSSRVWDSREFWWGSTTNDHC